MTDVWRVGAEKGKYTEHFVAGGYIALRLAGYVVPTSPMVTDKEATCGELYEKRIRLFGTKLAMPRVATNVGHGLPYFFGKHSSPAITSSLHTEKTNAFQRYGRRRIRSVLRVEPQMNGCYCSRHRRKVRLG